LASPNIAESNSKSGKPCLRHYAWTDVGLIAVRPAHEYSLLKKSAGLLCILSLFGLSDSIDDMKLTRHRRLFTDASSYRLHGAH